MRHRRRMRVLRRVLGMVLLGMIVLLIVLGRVVVFPRSFLRPVTLSPAHSRRPFSCTVAEWRYERDDAVTFDWEMESRYRNTIKDVLMFPFPGPISRNTATNPSNISSISYQIMMFIPHVRIAKNMKE